MDRALALKLLSEMATLQATHNEAVDPAWRTAGLAYYRAIWVECAELLDHYGWKWWKHQECDLPQVRLELVDIWHFGLSMLLLEGPVDEALAETVRSGLAGSGEPERFREAVETLAAAAVGEKRFDVPAFLACLRAVEMDLPGLYRAYVGKNVLNAFRQDHGYKAGTYDKLWQGREDNVHLVELEAILPVDAPGYREALYAALEARYAVRHEAPAAS
jgi:dimeric dUTPase (all-alpha-NTP-PPase superfamily)